MVDRVGYDSGYQWFPAEENIPFERVGMFCRVNCRTNDGVFTEFQTIRDGDSIQEGVMKYLPEEAPIVIDFRARLRLERSVYASMMKVVDNKLVAIKNHNSKHSLDQKSCSSEELAIQELDLKVERIQSYLELNDADFRLRIMIQTHPLYLECLAAGGGAESYIETLTRRHPLEAKRLAQITPSLAEYMKTKSLQTRVESRPSYVSSLNCSPLADNNSDLSERNLHARYKSMLRNQRLHSIFHSPPSHHHRKRLELAATHKNTFVSGVKSNSSPRGVPADDGQPEASTWQPSPTFTRMREAAPYFSNPMDSPTEAVALETFNDLESDSSASDCESKALKAPPVMSPIHAKTLAELPLYIFEPADITEDAIAYSEIHYGSTGNSSADSPTTNDEMNSSTTYQHDENDNYSSTCGGGGELFHCDYCEISLHEVHTDFDRQYHKRRLYDNSPSEMLKCHDLSTIQEKILETCCCEVCKPLLKPTQHLAKENGEGIAHDEDSTPRSAYSKPASVASFHTSPTLDNGGNTKKGKSNAIRYEPSSEERQALLSELALIRYDIEILQIITCGDLMDQTDLLKLKNLKQEEWSCIQELEETSSSKLNTTSKSFVMFSQAQDHGTPQLGVYLSRANNHEDESASSYSCMSTEALPFPSTSEHDETAALPAIYSNPTRRPSIGHVQSLLRTGRAIPEVQNLNHVFPFQIKQPSDQASEQLSSESRTFVEIVPPVYLEDDDCSSSSSSDESSYGVQASISPTSVDRLASRLNVPSETTKVLPCNAGMNMFYIDLNPFLAKDLSSLGDGPSEPLPDSTLSKHDTIRTRFGSTVSANTVAPFEDFYWSTKELLEISDSTRLEVLKSWKLTPRTIAKLSEILGQLIEDKELEDMVTLEIVVDAKLDKLFLAVIAKGNELSDGTAGPYHRIGLQAGMLLRAWQTRFKEQWFNIGSTRFDELAMGKKSRLMGVFMEIDPKTQNLHWITKLPRNPCANNLGAIGFEIGSWWLNTACAYRDGIIYTMDGMLDSGRDGLTSLCLLEGFEEGPEVGKTTFSREGSIKEITTGLMLHIGKTIRILRGHLLKSKFAPEAGLRYDGLYKIDSYGIKLEPNKNTWRSTVGLVRINGQAKTFEEIQDIPFPSQNDDWLLYQEIEKRQAKKMLKTAGKLMKKASERHSNVRWKG